jgi:hypothetical protein
MLHERTSFLSMHACGTCSCLAYAPLHASMLPCHGTGNASMFAPHSLIADVTSAPLNGLRLDWLAHSTHNVRMSHAIRNVARDRSLTGCALLRHNINRFVRKGGCPYGPTRPRGSAVAPPDRASMEPSESVGGSCNAEPCDGLRSLGAVLSVLAVGLCALPIYGQFKPTKATPTDRPFALRSVCTEVHCLQRQSHARCGVRRSFMWFVSIGRSVCALRAGNSMRAGVVWCGTGLLSAGESVLCGKLAVLYDRSALRLGLTPPSPIDPLRWITARAIREPPRTHA